LLVERGATQPTNYNKNQLEHFFFIIIVFIVENKQTLFRSQD